MNLSDQLQLVNQEINLHLDFIWHHEYYKNYRKLPENNKDDLADIMKITKDIYLKN